MRKKLIAWSVISILALATAILYLFVPPMAKNITYGVVFSQKHSADMGLDWKHNYLALLDDLQIKNIKLAAHWDLIEPSDAEYDFSDLDWQLKQAREHNAKIMLAIGMKTPRWPECHIPEWAKGLNKDVQQAKILEMLETVVLRYRNDPEVVSWHVENEPLFRFGECPWVDEAFLKKETALVRSLDAQKRPVIISDSGEGSWWFRAARIADVVGVTMYRRVYFDEFKVYVTYPIPPAFYWIKSKLVEMVFHKPVICVELQTEPWAANQLYDGGNSDAKTMTLDQFRQNIKFAQSTGFDTIYLWGNEWWYWMKEVHGQPEFWEEAKKLWQ